MYIYINEYLTLRLLILLCTEVEQMAILGDLNW